MEVARVHNKIKMLFGKISEPGYIMDSYYADGLINKISNETDPEAEFITSMPLLPDLVADAVGNMDHSHNTVKVFIIRTLAIVCHKELSFAKILSKRGDKLLESFNGINSDKMSASLRVAHMELAMALVSHNSGIGWLLETGLWRKILRLYERPGTVFVIRLMYKFAAEFMWKLNDLGDAANLNIVVESILKPIEDFDIFNMVSLTREQDEEIGKTLEPILHMLLNVVSRKDRFHKSSLIMSTLIKENNLVTHLYVASDKLRKEDVSLLVIKLLFTVILLRVFHTKPVGPNVVYTREDFMDLHVMYFNTMHFMMKRRNATLLLDYCNMCNQIWQSVCQNMRLESVEQHGRKIELQNQMLFICLVPILVYVNVNICKGKTKDFTNDRINEYIAKFINMTCEHTARAAYALRDLMLELDTLSVILQSVKRLTCLKGHLNDEQANIVFQALFFVLREYDPTDDYGEVPPDEENFEDSEQKVLVMTYVMDAVLSLVKNYNINWHESLEVICLNTVVHNILTKRPNLTCKFIVAALNVMAETVRKFLPPNLSLLLESKPGSAMHEIGKLIFMKMHEMHWEVRDSALELLHVCTEISFIKFPPMQKQILENNLINVAATIAFSDHEPYVQVSALKCVGAASKIPAIWDHLKFEHPNLQENLISMLRNNQEGIVRREACNVLCDIYQNAKLTPTFKQVLFEHMVSSAMGDFYWEVQLSALRFWRIIIQSLLTDQGMLDGKFPPVTFSRETRKIVTLNEAEIRKRLQRLLEELASNGCLTVLLKLLHDDTEAEVMDAALAISQDLYAILQQYKVSESIKPSEFDPASVSELVCDIKEESSVNAENGYESEPETTLKSDNVIEGILKSDDMNLLSNIYQKQMKLDSSNEPGTIPAPKIKLVKTASPYLFVNFIEVTDCKSVIKHKREWRDGIRNVSSLLDDVLGLYEINEEANSLDCY